MANAKWRLIGAALAWVLGLSGALVTGCGGDEGEDSAPPDAGEGGSTSDTRLPPTAEGGREAISDTRLPPTAEGRREAIGIGTVTGAVVDEAQHRLYFVGEPQRGRDGLDSTVVAAALLSVEGEPPYLSIDPMEGDLEGAWMDVRVSSGAADTKLGWTMFEADRLLKSYALGADTVTHYPVLSGVAGFKNSFAIALESTNDAGNDAPVWSRFWLRPATASAHTTNQGIDIVEAKMMVDTEAMVVRNGHLESAPDAVDEDAEKFADFFSRNYASFSDEAPIFGELEQVLRLMMIGEWLVRERVEVDRSWLMRHANVPFPMPRITPSLRREFNQTTETVDTVSELTLSLYGGVSFSEFELEVVDGEGELAPRRDELRAAASAAESEAFSVELDGESLVGFWVPLTGGESAEVEPVLETSVGSEASLTLYAWRDPETGDLSELMLPTLVSGTLVEGDTYEVVQLGDVEVPVRDYELYGARGESLGRFREHGVDQALGQIVVLPEEASSPYRLYIPDEEVVAAQGPDGEVLVFSVEDGRLREQALGDNVLVYEYAGGGALRQITTTDDEVLVRFRLGSNGSRILSGTVEADGPTVVFSEPAPGEQPVELVASHEGGESVVVTLQPGSADWTSDEEAGGLEYLTARGPEILERLAEDEARPHLIPYGGSTLLLVGNSLKQIPFPVSSYDRLLDALTREAVDAVLGIVPGGAGRTLVLTDDDGEPITSVFEGDRRTAVLRGDEGRVAFQEAEASLARSLNTEELRFVSLVESVEDESLVARCGDAEVSLTGDILDELSEDVDAAGPQSLVTSLMPNEMSYVLGRSATAAFSRVPPYDANALTHDLQASGEREVFGDHKYVRAVANFRVQRSVTSDEVDVTIVASESVGDALREALAAASGPGLQLVERPSARPRHVIVTDLDDADLRRYVGELKGTLIDSAILLIRVGRASNPDLYTELMHEQGLRYVVDHEEGLTSSSAALIVRAIAEVLSAAGDAGIHDREIFRDALRHGLDNYALTDDQASTWTRLWRRTLLQLSQSTSPTLPPASFAEEVWTRQGPPNGHTPHQRSRVEVG